VKCGEV